MSFVYTKQAGLITAFLLITQLVSASVSSEKLGTVSFPNSGSDKAQSHFLRGLAALHSFWYPEALSEFENSTKVDPAYAMGYWGQAMAYNHPL